MIKVENIETYGIEAAIRGMRNPLNSWNKSDSKECPYLDLDDMHTCRDCKHLERCNSNCFVLGENDLALMQRLYKAGPEHAKYLRMIFVTMDVLAPLYWWKEADTYKVGTVANSCSTMHKIHAKEFDIDDFSHEHLTISSMYTLYKIVDVLNVNRQEFMVLSSSEDKDKRNWSKEVWWQLIQLLPSSYNQRRTLSMSYANVMNIINQRENHKLDEWRAFCSILRSLPYVKAIRGEE